MFEEFFRAIGRGIVAVFAAIFMPALHAAGNTLAVIARWVVIAAILGFGAVFMIRNHPETLNAVLTLAIGIAVVGFGFWIMIRPFSRRPP